MKALYYDCFAGISGDMNLGAMIDIGVSSTFLMDELRRLPLDGYELRIDRAKRKGICGTQVNVALLHSPGENDRVFHRTYADIVELIDKSGLSEAVRTISLRIFERLARAEAKVHGQDVRDVHFHEVGAIDSIIDIVGAAVCLEALKVDKVFSSPVQVGGGFVQCAHGMLPVPAPATAEILMGAPMRTGGAPFEMTTPTGAAILAATVDEFTEQIQFTPVSIGYGIGQRDTDIPNALRIMTGRLQDCPSVEDLGGQEAFLVECNIDDMIPELYEDLMDSLFESGALDVFFTPVIMKKSRPAIKVTVLCGCDERARIERILLLRTSTFGLRSYPVVKKMLQRDFTKRLTKYGEITVKNAYFNGEKVKSKPEYEDCKRLAKEKGVSLKQIYDSIFTDDP